MNGFFITGTDTGVGKTVVTAILLRYLIQTGRAARPVKPVQSGCLERKGQRIAPDLEFVLQVAGLQLADSEKEILCPNRFLLPASPHLAAEWEGEHIDWQQLQELPRHSTFADQCLVVEGAGGLYVPITRDHTMLDLIQSYALPVFLVARAGLGTLNHSMLSIEALRGHGCTIAAVILNDTTGKENPEIIRDNRETLSHMASAPVLGPIPHIPGLDTEHPDAHALFSQTLQDWPGYGTFLEAIQVYSRIM